MRLTSHDRSAGGPAQASLEEQLSDAGHNREVVRTEIAQRDKMITDLRRQLARQSAEINELKAAQSQFESNLRAGDATKQDLSEQKAALAQKLESAQNNSHSLEEKLDSLAQQSAQDAARAKASESKVNYPSPPFLLFSIRCKLVTPAEIPS